MKDTISIILKFTFEGPDPAQVMNNYTEFLEEIINATSYMHEHIVEIIVIKGNE